MNKILKSKLISLIAILCFMFGFGIAAYEISYEKGRINNVEFTVSESLAFGDEPGLVTLFTIGIIAYMYLIKMKGPKEFLYIRLFLLLLIYSFLITIIWITTYKDKRLHYIFAFIIFLSTFIYHILTYISFSKKCSALMCNCLLVACLLNILVIIGLGATKIIKPITEKNETRITFASLENTFLLIVIFVMFVIGFLS